jgi:hypothetical protein
VKNQGDVIADLICEGPCNPGLRAADDDLSAMPAFVRKAAYLWHKALFPGSVIFICQACGWHRRYGGNSVFVGDVDDRQIAMLNAAKAALDA